MVSTYTPNINLEEPARGDQVGTWDTPVNANMTLTDLVVGGIASITLNNSPVVLSAAQFQARNITFSSTLTGSCAITFPSTFKKSYEIQNLCTGSSAFVITLGTTVSGGQAICCPPGETIDCFNDGTNIKFKNLGRVGGYWDYGGSSVPAWVTGCTVPPFLNCDASVFSAVTYPALAVILPGLVLPDRRGTTGYTLNQGTARITSASGALDGNTILATKVTQTFILGTTNMPPYTPTVNSFSLSWASGLANYGIPAGAGGGYFMNSGYNAGGINPGVSGSITMNGQGGVSAPVSAIGTGTVYGICMIRAA